MININIKNILSVCAFISIIGFSMIDTVMCGNTFDFATFSTKDFKVSTNEGKPLSERIFVDEKAYAKKNFRLNYNMELGALQKGDDGLYQSEHVIQNQNKIVGVLVEAEEKEPKDQTKPDQRRSKADRFKELFKGHQIDAQGQSPGPVDLGKNYALFADKDHRISIQRIGGFMAEKGKTLSEEVPKTVKASNIVLRAQGLEIDKVEVTKSVDYDESMLDEVKTTQSSQIFDSLFSPKENGELEYSGFAKEKFVESVDVKIESLEINNYMTAIIGSDALAFGQNVFGTQEQFKRAANKFNNPADWAQLLEDITPDARGELLGATCRDAGTRGTISHSANETNSAAVCTAAQFQREYDTLTKQNPKTTFAAVDNKKIQIGDEVKNYEVKPETVAVAGAHTDTYSAELYTLAARHIVPRGRFLTTKDNPLLKGEIQKVEDLPLDGTLINDATTLLTGAKLGGDLTDYANFVALSQMRNANLLKNVKVTVKVKFNKGKMEQLLKIGDLKDSELIVEKSFQYGHDQLADFSKDTATDFLTNMNSNVMQAVGTLLTETSKTMPDTALVVPALGQNVRINTFTNDESLFDQNTWDKVPVVGYDLASIYETGASETTFNLVDGYFKHNDTKSPFLSTLFGRNIWKKKGVKGPTYTNGTMLTEHQGIELLFDKVKNGMTTLNAKCLKNNYDNDFEKNDVFISFKKEIQRIVFEDLGIIEEDDGSWDNRGFFKNLVTKAETLANKSRNFGNFGVMRSTKFSPILDQLKDTLGLKEVQVKKDDENSVNFAVWKRLWGYEKINATPAEKKYKLSTSLTDSQIATEFAKEEVKDIDYIKVVKCINDYLLENNFDLFIDPETQCDFGKLVGLSDVQQSATKKKIDTVLSSSQLFYKDGVTKDEAASTFTVILTDQTMANAKKPSKWKHSKSEQFRINNFITEVTDKNKGKDVTIEGKKVFAKLVKEKQIKFALGELLSGNQTVEIARIDAMTVDKVKLAFYLNILQKVKISLKAQISKMPKLLEQLFGITEEQKKSAKINDTIIEQWSAEELDDHLKKERNDANLKVNFEKEYSEKLKEQKDKEKAEAANKPANQSTMTGTQIAMYTAGAAGAASVVGFMGYTAVYGNETFDIGPFF